MLQLRQMLAERWMENLTDGEIKNYHQLLVEKKKRLIGSYEYGKGFKCPKFRVNKADCKFLDAEPNQSSITCKRPSNTLGLSS